MIKRYHALWKNARDIILLLSTTGEIMEANPAAVHAYGYSFDELLTKTIFDLRVDNECTTELLQTAEKTGLFFETIHKRKDGSTLDVEVSIQGTHIKGNTILMSVIRDISQRKATEKALKESEEKFRSVFDNASDALLLHEIINEDGNFRFIEINDVAHQKLEYTCEELNSLSIKQICTMSEAEMKSIVLKLQDNPAQMFEATGISKSGKEIPFEVTSRYFFLNGKSYGLSIARDITQRKSDHEKMMRAKEQAEEANRVKSEFLANMSHEIRTPINGIVGMIDLTLMTELNEEHKDNLVTAKVCADSLLSIINDILDFSKLEAGKLMIREIDFNIQDFVEQTIKAHSPKAYNKGLQFSHSIDQDIPKILMGDPNRIRQVLDNLIDNAIKFTDRGEVSVSIKNISQTKEHIELRFIIEDSGKGIASAEIDHLYEAFNQMDSSITRQYGGTGLGLTIAKQLVTLMGGTLWAHSDQGQGSVFSFCIRLMIGHQSPETITPTPTPRITKTPKPLTILVVEDYKINQILIMRMLKERGHIADSADNGLEALKLYEKKVYDVILMDIQMPVLDGIETTRRIRELEEGSKRHTPIIAVTAYALEGDRERFLYLGMDDYIPKPIDMMHLYMKIEDITDKTSDFPDRIVLGDGGDVLFSNKTNSSKPMIDSLVLSEIDGCLSDLESFIESDNHFAMEATANRIKNLCNGIEADDLKHRAFKIELSSRKNDLNKVNEHYRILREEYSTFKKSLRS